MVRKSPSPDLVRSLGGVIPRGYSMNRTRVRRLMRQMGLRALSRRLFAGASTTGMRGWHGHHFGSPAPRPDGIARPMVKCGRQISASSRSAQACMHLEAMMALVRVSRCRCSLSRRRTPSTADYRCRELEDAFWPISWVGDLGYGPRRPVNGYEGRLRRVLKAHVREPFSMDVQHRSAAESPT